MSANNELGSRIKQIRKGLNLTQRELAERLNVTPPTISEIESGRYNPSIEFLIRLNKEFNVNLYYLLLGEGQMYIDPEILSLTRIEEYAVNVDEVRKFLCYFQKSEILQYFILSQFKSKMAQEKEAILKEIEESEKKSNKDD